jgi:voltage-gated potassium channel
MLFLITIVRFVKGIVDALRDPEFRVLLALVVLTLIAGMFFYHRVEGWTLFDALYFSVVTLTTVGYGDLAPQTGLGKAFTMIYLFVGIGTLLGFINLMAKPTYQRETDSEKTE